MKKLLIIIWLVLLPSLVWADDTVWPWDLYLIVPKPTVTVAKMNAFASIYHNNGSGESAANEYLAFNSVVKFSLTGVTPVTHYGMICPVRQGMVGPMNTWTNSLSGASYVAVAAVPLTNHVDHEVIGSTVAGITAGQIIYWDGLVQYLHDTWGLQVIP